VDHGVLLHKVRDIGISGKLGVWLYSFLANRIQYVRIPGGFSQDSPVISGVPQGTVLGPLLFLIIMSDINSSISSSKLISFADDTRVYANIKDPEDCDNLQSDLNNIYSWASENMLFNAKKFQYISFNASLSNNACNVYLCPEMTIIGSTQHANDLGIHLSSNCSFDHHINLMVKRCTRLTGWILRTFSTRDRATMLTLFRALVLSRIDYGCQLWSPYKSMHIVAIEKIQKNFSKRIAGYQSLSYSDRLKSLRLFSLQRRRERYMIIYVWKIFEEIVPQFSNPMIFTLSGRRGRLCSISNVEPGRIGTLCYNSFRWRAARLFNSIPKCIRNVSNCSTDCFKRRLDNYLSSVPDNPCIPNIDNSLVCVDGSLADLWRLPRDGLAD
jgi:hypothetical protein